MPDLDYIRFAFQAEFPKSHDELLRRALEKQGDDVFSAARMQGADELADFLSTQGQKVLLGLSNHLKN